MEKNNKTSQHKKVQAKCACTLSFSPVSSNSDKEFWLEVYVGTYDKVRMCESFLW